MLLTILCLFAVVLVAGARREETVEDARSIRTELEEIERSMIVLAERNGWEDGREVTIDELLPEVRTKFKRLHKTKADALGNAYGPFWIGQLPGLPDASHAELDGKVSAGYWDPYGKQSESRDGIYRNYHTQNEEAAE